MVEIKISAEFVTKRFLYESLLSIAVQVDQGAKNGKLNGGYSWELVE